MRIAWLDFEYLVRHSGHPPFPAHQFVASIIKSDKDIVLTASTADLRAYIQNVAAMPKAFQKDEMFHRQ